MSRAVLACALALAAPVFAATRFAPIPAPEAKTKPPGLELRIVSYDGNTNGVLTVEVKNPTSAAVDFSPSGLYFVPAMNPDQAPQRLGAVGTFQQQQGQEWKRNSIASIAAGETQRVRLDVYCIDSHRPSPTSTTPFRLGKDRIPVSLSTAIHNEAAKETAGQGGMAAPAARSTVQGVVWKNRDAKWIRLDGEGQQEATK